MNTLNDGGPAFPHKIPKYADQHLLEVFGSGMSLLDWFAGQALAGLAANPERASAFATPATDNPELYLPEVARLAYAAAEAMLKERAKRYDRQND